MKFRNWAFLLYFFFLCVSIGPKALGMLGKYSATKPSPQPSWPLFKWKPLSLGKLSTDVRISLGKKEKETLWCPWCQGGQWTRA